MALFRAAHDLWLHDEAFARLVNRIEAYSPEFKRWWSEHRVSVPVSGTRYLNHPVHGPARYIYSSFQANNDGALKLAVYARD